MEHSVLTNIMSIVTGHQQQFGSTDVVWIRERANFQETLKIISQHLLKQQSEAHKMLSCANVYVPLIKNVSVFLEARSHVWGTIPVISFSVDNDFYSHIIHRDFLK
jgi:hypothetical protein